MLYDYHAASEPIQARTFEQDPQLPLQSRWVHHVISIHARDVAAACVGGDQIERGAQALMEASTHEANSRIVDAFQDCEALIR